MSLPVHPCVLRLPGDPMRDGLVVQRLVCHDLHAPPRPMEVRACNVPLIIVLHGHGLIDWGCDSPETADLALSLLALFIPVGADGYSGHVADDIPVSRFAWNHHCELAVRHLSALPHEGGRLDAEFLRIWIAGRWPWRPGTREPRPDLGVDLSRPPEDQ